MPRDSGRRASRRPTLVSIAFGGAVLSAEAPILVVEALFGALAFFTLVGPLGLPWWAPLGVLGLVGVVWLLLDKLSRLHGNGWRTGLAVLGQLRGRNSTILLGAFGGTAELVDRAERLAVAARASDGLARPRA